MSFNISHTETLCSTLRISRENVAKAEEIELPELNPLDDLEFGEDDYATIEELSWSSEGSGNAHEDGRLAAFVALTEGEADIIFTWEGGEAHSGLRIREGKMAECEVVMALAPEEAPTSKTTKKGGA